MNNLVFNNENRVIDIKDNEIIFISEMINSNVTFNVFNKCKIISNFNSNKSSKNNIEINLLDKQANLTIREIALSKEETKVEKNITINHCSKETFSDYKFFGFAIGNSNLKISVKSKILKNMKKSEAHQIIRILTSENAKATGEPGLLIDDFDVKASHGNSIGQISMREIYYLQTKGFSKKEAEWLILNGHLFEALQGLKWKTTNKIINDFRKNLNE